jgi:predicted  nucleic acid-binding Zn-ribbon protein
MKAVAEVHSADQYCHHLCSNPACGHVFPDVPRKDWSSVAEQCCPECATARFKYIAGRLVPQKRCALA